MDSAVPHQQSRGPEAEQLTTARNDGRPAVHHAKETPSSPLLSQRRHPGKSQSYQEQIPQATGSTKTEEPRTEVAAEAPAPAQTYERKIQQRILDEPLVQHQHSKAQDQLFAEPYLEVLDNGVAVNWKKAAVNVDNFVRSLTLNSTDGPCSSPPRVWDDLDPDLQNTLLCWTPRAREIFQDPQRMQYLCAARIWHTLHDYVFSADPRRIREWMGPDWGHFAELKETFKGWKLDEPWKRSNMDAAYNVWKWYTANILCRKSGFVKDRLTEDVGRQVMQDLASLLSANGDDTKSWEHGIQSILGPISLVFEYMLRSSSKHWLAWKPEGCADAWGFSVSSATDEGWNVMMEPMETITWSYREGRKEDLNGEEVHLVVRSALVVALFFDGDPSYHYVAPMSVIVDDHLAPNDEISGRQGEQLH